MRILLIAITESEAARDLLPVAASCARRFPAASITFLTAAEWAPALRCVPLLDRVETVPPEADSILESGRWDLVIDAESPPWSDRTPIAAEQILRLRGGTGRLARAATARALRLPPPWRFLAALEPPQPPPLCLPLLRRDPQRPDALLAEWIETWSRTPTPHPATTEPALPFDVEALLAEAEDRAADDLRRGRRGGAWALAARPALVLLGSLLRGRGIHRARQRALQSFLRGALLWEARHMPPADPTRPEPGNPHSAQGVS